MHIDRLNNITLIIDRHKKEVQLGIYTVSLGGLIYALRSVRLVQKFRHAKDLPQSFINRKLTLYGTVLNVEVSTPLVLRVDHIPILASALRRRSEPGLAVNISSVNILSNGISWLQCLLKEKQIRFTLLKRQNDFLHCIVYFEGKKNVAEELLKLGFATVDVIDFDLQNDKLYSKYYKSLLHLENKAEKNKVGIWSDVEPKFLEKFKIRLMAALYKIFP